jgi:hypothetical protein
MADTPQSLWVTLVYKDGTTQPAIAAPRRHKTPDGYTEYAVAIDQDADAILSVKVDVLPARSTLILEPNRP